MTSIIISSDDPKLCSALGKKTADALGYSHLDETYLERVASESGVPEEKLRSVLDPAASRRVSGRSRDQLLTQIAAGTLEALQEDDIVCTGLAAHLYVHGVSHIMSVRVLGFPDDLVDRVVAASHVSVAKAQRIVKQERERRIKWSVGGFGLDEADPSVYDMVLSVGQIEIDKIVHMITELAEYRKFRPMTYSRSHLAELTLAARVSGVLLPSCRDVRVKVAGNRAIVHVKCSSRAKRTTAARIKEAARQIDGIEAVEVHATSSAPRVSGLRTSLPFA